jgi:hypothetical protein
MSRTHDVTISAFDLDRIESELAAVTEQRDRMAKACDQYSEDEILCKLQEITKQRDRLADQIEANHKGTLMLERMVYQLREQNDRLTEAIRKHRDELELTSGESVDRMLWNTLAAVKENQKTDSQSCPECDALASYGSNDGPCETHKL